MIYRIQNLEIIWFTNDWLNCPILKIINKEKNIFKNELTLNEKFSMIYLINSHQYLNKTHLYIISYIQLYFRSLITIWYSWHEHNSPALALTGRGPFSSKTHHHTQDPLALTGREPFSSKTHHHTQHPFALTRRGPLSSNTNSHTRSTFFRWRSTQKHTIDLFFFGHRHKHTIDLFLVGHRHKNT